MALLLEGKEQDIIDIRANGSLSPFYLSYFWVMELSSPFLYKSIIIDKMVVIKTDIFITSVHPFSIKLPIERKYVLFNINI